MNLECQHTREALGRKDEPMTYQPPSTYTQATHDQILALEQCAEAFEGIRDILLSLPGGRRLSVALTQLETAQMWVNKAIVKGDKK